jgi:hypothetical protein
VFLMMMGEVSMTGRTHFVLTTILTGGSAIVVTVAAVHQWRAHWPLNLTWATLLFALVWPVIVGHAALWNPAVSRERLERACLHLLTAALLAIAVSMLLLVQTLLRVGR